MSYSGFSAGSDLHYRHDPLDCERARIDGSPVAVQSDQRRKRQQSFAGDTFRNVRDLLFELPPPSPRIERASFQQSVLSIDDVGTTPG
jgi:hypothetical protein